MQPDGENVRAYVTLAENCEKPSAADLVVHCRERIGYKAPEEIVSSTRCRSIPPARSTAWV